MGTQTNVDRHVNTCGVSTAMGILVELYNSVVELCAVHIHVGGGVSRFQGRESDITARLYGYQYEYKKLAADQHPEYTTDFSLRVYYRYATEEDARLLCFDRIDERYFSHDYCYVVGWLPMSELLLKAAELRQRDVFVAAFPED